MDLVEIERIESAMRDPRFLERILTPDERRLQLSPIRVAGRWAAKEAIAKAIGLHLTWQKVQVLNDSTGAPSAQVDDRAFDPVKHRLHLSITHEHGHAAAVAVWELVV